MRRAEALAGAQDRAQRLLPLDRAVGHLDRLEAGVAVAAGLDRLAEIVEQRPAPAGRRLAIADQRVEALVLAPAAVLAGALLVDEHAPHADVGQAVAPVRFGRLPVAPGAADLLEIGRASGRERGCQYG